MLSVVTNAAAPVTATCRMSVGRLPKLSKAVEAAVVCEHTTHDCQSRGVYKLGKPCIALSPKPSTRNPLHPDLEYMTWRHNLFSHVICCSSQECHDS